MAELLHKNKGNNFRIEVKSENYYNQIEREKLSKGFKNNKTINKADKTL